MKRYEQGGVQAASKLWRHLSHGEIFAEDGERVLRLLGDLGTVTGSLYRKYALHRMINKPPEQVALKVTLDPKPDPDSRIALTDDRDSLGMPKVKLDWRLTEDDERSMALLAQRVAGELTRLGYGRVRLHPSLQQPGGGWARAGNLVGHGLAPDAPEMHISWHHMGTTRMAMNPREGVVDADCRVHGTTNLYVAGSSVFPTSGNANPTLTIVALTLRLADHLKGDGLASDKAPLDFTLPAGDQDQMVVPHAEDLTTEG